MLLQDLQSVVHAVQELIALLAQAHVLIALQEHIILCLYRQATRPAWHVLSIHSVLLDLPIATNAPKEPTIHQNRQPALLVEDINTVPSYGQNQPLIV